MSALSQSATPSHRYNLRPRPLQPARKQRFLRLGYLKHLSKHFEHFHRHPERVDSIGEPYIPPPSPSQSSACTEGTPDSIPFTPSSVDLFGFGARSPIPTPPRQESPARITSPPKSPAHQPQSQSKPKRKLNKIPIPKLVDFQHVELPKRKRKRTIQPDDILQLSQGPGIPK